jgi:hypothetical protein
MYNYSNSKILTFFPFLGLIIFVSFTTIAILFYPGSTYLDPNSVGYNFFYNFLSDLGRTLTFNYENNFLSAFFFNNAMFICGILFIFFYIALPCYFYDDSFLYTCSIFGSILCGLGSASFTLVGLTPADLYLSQHIFFADNIFYISFPGAIIYSFVILRSRNLPHIYGMGYFSFSIALIAYILILEIGPPPRTEFGLIVQATAQKIIAICFVFAAWMLARGIKKYFN